uniref:Uncharacterized protein n=1 Tax=Myoviridae sp. ctTBm11 TaxID=2825108 RepID=A0A8S5PQX5_9CAUD|nr:MAG TPA: hypothetical protein [Myoviridae sp. ctTBm11]
MLPFFLLLICVFVFFIKADKTHFDYAGPQYSKIMTDFQRIIR